MFLAFGSWHDTYTIQINPSPAGNHIHFQQDFMDSIEAVSFFIHFRNLPNADDVQSDSLDNCKTSERLVITGINQPFQHLTIARHPM
jgi:hypothetical protein